MAAAWFQAVTRLVAPAGSTNATLRFDGARATITYSSVPEFQYITERSTNLNTGAWLPIGTNTVSPSGLFQFQDLFHDLSGIPPAAFYRLLQR